MENMGCKDFYKTLLTLRKSNPALKAGDPASTTVRLKTNAENSVLAYVRKNGNREVLVLLNMSKEPVHCVIDDANLHGKYTDVFHKTVVDLNEQKSFELQPWAYLVYEK
jgi:glycosidase